jgi:glucose-6-phosphate 1-epimerase
VSVDRAHVVSYEPVGQSPVLWLSRESRFAAGAAIRGGVPLCFPWFGAHASDSKLPAHGFARTREFRYLGSRSEQGVTRLSFELAADDATRALWPHEFVARHHVALGAELTLEFEVENRGLGSFEFEEALHSYFAVEDARRVRVEGLSGASYADKVAGTRAVQREAQVTVEGELDRVYDSAATCVLHDGERRRIAIEKSGSATTVVWNPWIDKARRMSDFGDDEYLAMLCVESANTGRAKVSLAPGERHALRVSFHSSIS